MVVAADGRRREREREREREVGAFSVHHQLVDRDFLKVISTIDIDQ